MIKNLSLVYRSFGMPEDVLCLEQTSVFTLAEDSVRVKMLFSPVNASDLIPITGAYQHRISPPVIAGYEGVGIVVETSKGNEHLLGKRVLPLRGEGTWQKYVVCKACLAIPVPDEIDNVLAARAYINPVAAKLMLRLYSPANRRILLTAAGSDCAKLIGQWALKSGAKEVAGICRSSVHMKRLAEYGITPLLQDDIEQIKDFATKTDIVFDATGGYLAELLLGMMKKDASFVCYGLLSGQPFSMKQSFPRVYWFHIRNYLKDMGTNEWQSLFTEIWPQLQTSAISEARLFSLSNWKEALGYYHQPGRIAKPVICMDSEATD